MTSRRAWLRGVAGAGLAAAGETAVSAQNSRATVAPRPVIDITDLYHPYQDVGDNFDIIAAYALPSIDLKAVVFDCTQSFRTPISKDRTGKVIDNTGPREAGVIPVTQLNYIFDRRVPYAYGPFSPLRSPEDAKTDVPKFQQSGIELVLETLHRSQEKVDIVSFGSARVVAAAWNREPQLMRDKCRRIHISAGTTTPTFMEWNVDLDPAAIMTLVRSGLPICFYPCAIKEGPFSMDRHNTYYQLRTLDFIREMDPRLRSYLAFAFTRCNRVDFLRAIDEDWPADVIDQVCERTHHVWETAIWMDAANLKLVLRAGGGHRLIHASEVQAGDTILPNELRPCSVTANPDGHYVFALTAGPSNFHVYDRVNAEENQSALRQALPALYRSFSPGRRA